MIYDLTGKRVYVAGHTGMIGSALLRRLSRERCEVLVATRSDLDLREQSATAGWIKQNRPQVIFLAAGWVGGIVANDSYPADFLGNNLAIGLNVVRAAYESGVEKLICLGSSCIYPKAARQPITEDALLTGPLEPTNEWYAVAKIAAIKLCQAYRKQYGCDFISLMPTNLYGPNDNYHPEHSHVAAALLRRIHEAKLADAPSVTVWGSGTPRREFLFADDAADACVFAAEQYSGGDILNVGTGVDVSIGEFAHTVADVVGFKGKLVFDRSRPDGTPHKLLDVSKMRQLGWEAKTSLRDGLYMAYDDFVANGGRVVSKEPECLMVAREF